MGKEEKKEKVQKSASKAEEKAPAKKSVAKKSSSKKIAAAKSTVKKSAVKKSTAKKQASAKSTTKKSAAKKISTAESTVKKSTGKKSTTKKPAAKKRSSTKTTPQKKSAPKKAELAKKTSPKKKAEYRPSLLAYHREKATPALMKELGYTNSLEVPRLNKITLNVGMGDARNESGSLEKASEDLATITGQKAVVTKARKAISNFKLRIGDPVGCRVTLRRWKMYEFLERLVSIALPRVRDFRGLSAKSFDGHGNYSMGIEEHVVFPEIDYDKIDKIRGMNVTIVTTAQTDQEGYELLKLLGLPFRLDNRFERAKKENSNVAEEGDSVSNELTEAAEVA